MNLVKKKVLTFKFFFITTIAFLCIAILTLKDLKALNTMKFVSIFDSILYSFESFQISYSILNIIKIISIYLILFYIILKFSLTQLNESSYLVILRLKNLNIFLINMFKNIFLIVCLYFILGYCIIFVVNRCFPMSFHNGAFLNLFNLQTNYSKLIINSFILNIVIGYSISLLMILVSILLTNVRYGFLYVFSLFCIGSMSKLYFIPGYHIILSKIDITVHRINFIFYNCVLYILLIIFSICSILFISKYKKDLIYNYNDF